VLSPPLTFALSQDQTLQLKTVSVCPAPRRSYLEPFRTVGRGSCEERGSSHFTVVAAYTLRLWLTTKADYWDPRSLRVFRFSFQGPTTLDVLTLRQRVETAPGFSGEDGGHGGCQNPLAVVAEPRGAEESSSPRFWSQATFALFFERPEGPLLSHRGSARRPALALSLPVSVSGDRHSVVTRWSARSRTLASFRFESSDFFARRSLFQRPLGAFTSRAPKGCLVPAHPFREAGS